MQLSDHGIKAIKNFEGLRLTAYRDSAGVWTIGYGSTRYHDDKAVKPGDKLANEVQATALFNNTLAQYVDAVNNYVKVPLTQNQFDALVSFTYNAGIGALRNSTLLKKLNASDYSGAADQFLFWNKITDPHTGEKVVSNVLKARRTEERGLFLSTK
ncbi:MAG TPA: lysozyme [Mucilaginibacter sp.]|nr:lysozyme [Mucilaginibacter sp.]